MFNEFDGFKCDWLRNLSDRELIAPGTIYERDIRDITPSELMGFTQCHFFAGIGVWSYALREAGYSDSERVWTASCPCQPFSASGKRGGFDDERHLWPSLFWLIDQCKPDCIIGEQVASKDGFAWFDLVASDMEGIGYTIGAVDICAAGFGAPHRRQRFYWVAYTPGVGRNDRGDHREERYIHNPKIGTDAKSNPTRNKRLSRPGQNCDATSRYGGLAQSASIGRGSGNHGDSTGNDGQVQTDGRDAFTNGFWADAEWFHCTDGKERCSQPGIFPLAHGATQRVGRLHAYGDAIVAPQAIEFVKVAMELRP